MTAGHVPLTDPSPDMFASKDEASGKSCPRAVISAVHTCLVPALEPSLSITTHIIVWGEIPLGVSLK